MYEIFFIIGAVLIFGFITSLIFERTKFPDVIILMSVGMFAGRILDTFGITYLTSEISAAAPFIGAIALMIILFDGGLHLNLFNVLNCFPQAAGFTVLGFSLTVLSMGTVMNLIFGWTYLEGLLLGAVVGGTSSAIVFPIVSKLTMSEKSKIVLGLESAMTDALCIVVTIALIDIIVLGTIDTRSTASSIASAFSTAAVVAAVFATFWIGMLNKLYVRQVGYILTLAVVFILFSVVEMVKGSGAIAVLVFALLLSNFSELAKRLKIKGEFSVDTSLHTCQTNISFLVYIFFFIFIGLTFDTSALNYTILKTVGVITVILLAARVLSVKALTMSDKSVAPFAKAIIAAMPRGLAAGVLASMPLAAGIRIPYFAEIVFSLIFLTNLTTTFGVFFIERAAAKMPLGR